jgi:hypothetical protein
MLPSYKIIFTLGACALYSISLFGMDNPNPGRGHRRTPSLHDTISAQGSPEEVKQILESGNHEGIDTPTDNPLRETPLFVATHNGDVVVARLLLDKGADINAQNAGGQDVLQQAEMHRDAFVRLFMMYGLQIEPERRATVILHPLIEAAINDDATTIRSLIENNPQSSEDQMPGEVYQGEQKATMPLAEALAYAAGNGSYNAVRELILLGARPFEAHRVLRGILLRQTLTPAERVRYTELLHAIEGAIHRFYEVIVHSRPPLDMPVQNRLEAIPKDSRNLIYDFFRGQI